MNLYIRYFDNEVLVHDIEEALDFLLSISEIQMTPQLEKDLRDYVMSDVYYPKRYKVRPRIYFIVIKTEAATMLDFKQKKALRTPDKNSPKPMSIHLEELMQENPGWYEGTVDFKRVVVNPSTGKCEYIDTTFVAQCKANSAKDCYDRLIEHLSMRVDRRSQFPSVKGDNFNYKYLGACRQ